MAHARLLASLMLVCLLGVGCSQGLCDRAQSIHTSLVAKAAPCNVDVGTFNPTSCKQNVSACTGNDSTNINAAFDCVDKLGTCAPANARAWEDSLAQCQSTILVSTPACARAVSAQ